MERYKNICSLDKNLYVDGSPVIIAAGELLKDNKDSRVLIHLKMQNIYKSELTFCRIAIRAFEPNGNEVEGIDSYSYLDLEVSSGQFFGTKIPIYLPVDSTRKFEVAVVEVVYSDGFVWKHEYQKWQPLGKIDFISDVIMDAELVKQYRIDVNSDVVCKPQRNGSAFLCVCGKVSYGNRCNYCGNTYEYLIQMLDEEGLAQRRIKRLQDEKEKTYQSLINKIEQSTSEEDYLQTLTALEKIADYKDVPEYISSLKKKIDEFSSEKIYNSAIQDMNAKDIKCVQNALVSLRSLGDFKDSKEKVAETQKNIEKIKRKIRNKKIIIFGVFSVLLCVIIAYTFAYFYQKKAEYERGKQYMASGEYEKAYNIFIMLGDYSDVDDLANEACYLLANDYYESHNYEQAIKLWESIIEYSDSETRISSIEQEILDEEILLMQDSIEKEYKQGLYEEAYYDYLKLERQKGFLGTDEDKSKYAYAYCMALIEKKRYKEAYSISYDNNLEERYRETEFLCDIRYAYVYTHKKNDDEKTLEYLKYLVEKEYLDTQEIYDKLYSYEMNININSTVAKWNKGRHPTKIITNSDNIINVKIHGGSPEKQKTAGEIEFSSNMGWKKTLSIELAEGNSYKYNMGNAKKNEKVTVVLIDSGGNILCTRELTSLTY